MSLVEQLQESPVFKSVESAGLDALVNTMQTQTFPAGTVIFRKGEPGDSMYIITKGKLRIYTTDQEGNDITLTFFEPVHVFGDFSLLDRLPRSASAAAIEDMEALVLSRDAFLAFLPEYPSVGLAMLRSLADRVRYITSYMNRIGDLAQRLSSGDYDKIIQELTANAPGADDSDIKGLISAFVQMVHSVRDREDQLKSAGSEG